MPQDGKISVGSVAARRAAARARIRDGRFGEGFSSPAKRLGGASSLQEETTSAEEGGFSSLWNAALDVLSFEVPDLRPDTVEEVPALSVSNSVANTGDNHALVAKEDKVLESIASVETERTKSRSEPRRSRTRERASVVAFQPRLSRQEPAQEEYAGPMLPTPSFSSAPTKTREIDDRVQPHSQAGYVPPALFASMPTWGPASGSPTSGGPISTLHGVAPRALPNGMESISPPLPSPTPGDLRTFEGFAPRGYEPNNFTALPPTVALRLLPRPEDAIIVSSQAVAVRRASPLPAALAGPPGMVTKVTPAPDFHQILWQEVSEAYSQLPPASPLPSHLSYEAIVKSQLGPLALDPSGHVPVQRFTENVLAGNMAYEAQSYQVKLPPEKPDYGKMFVPLRPEFDSSGEVKTSSKVDMLAALTKNMELRKVIELDAARLRTGMPDSLGRMGFAEAVKEDAPVFYKVQLQILVLKATALPPPEALYSCDPYCRVSVIDGDPFGDAALAGGEGWYVAHEQWGGDTPDISDTTDPEWRTRLRAEIIAHEHTRLHFKVFDRDEIKPDPRPLGDVVISLAEVQRDEWYAPRAVALQPPAAMRSDQKAWAKLRASRLFVAVTWEGMPSALKSRPGVGASGAGSLSAAAAFAGAASRARRSPRRPRTPSPTPGFLGGIGGAFTGVLGRTRPTEPEDAPEGSSELAGPAGHASGS